MTDVAPVLARLRPGDPGGVRRVRRLPTDADLAVLDSATARTVTLTAPASTEVLLGRLAAVLEFPPWFGRNWDALGELLAAPQPADERAIVIVWHHPETLSAEDRGRARVVFEGAAAARQRLGRRPLIVMTEVELEHPMDRLVPLGLRSIGRIHHVAFVVRSIDASLGLWRDLLGLHLEAVMAIEHDRVTIAFLGVGESKVELVQPADDTTGVARFLATKGEGFHHVCFEIPDLTATLQQLAADGAELIDTAPRRGAEGPVAFLHPRASQGVLVELIEAPGGPAWERLGIVATA